MEFFGAVAIALLILMGRDQIKTGHMTPGIFVTFLIMVFRLYDPVRKFAQFNNNFQQALGASSSIFSFMDVEDDVQEKPHAKVIKAFRNNIRFDHVSFSYNDEEHARDVLQDIDLEVKKGEVLAIVGSSGCGKEHANSPDSALLRRDRRANPGGWDGRARSVVALVAIADCRGYPGHHPV